MMTKEKLERKAEELCVYNDQIHRDCFVNGYVTGALKREQRIADLEKLLEEEKKLNAEIKARFVKCNTCTDEMKSKCLMFSENLCEGERCEELVDLMSLVEKRESDDGIKTAKDIIERLVTNAPDTYSGTNVELQQSKMFAFSNALNEACDFLKGKI